MFQSASEAQRSQADLSSDSQQSGSEEPPNLPTTDTVSPLDISPWRNPLKPHPTRWALAVVAGVMVATGTAIALPRLLITQSQQTHSTLELPVQTTTVTSVQAYTVTRSYTGQVTATRTSEIGFEQSGTLVWVGVDQGDRVQTGDAIARLDTQNLEAHLNQLRAQKAQAEAVLQELRNGPRAEVIAAAQAQVSDLQNQLALEDIRRDRREYLQQEGAISREQLDEVTYNRNALQARLRTAHSQLLELENGTRTEQIAAQLAVVQQLEASIADVAITIAKSTIRAPFAGVIGERYLDEGVVVNAGQAIVRVVEGGRSEVEVGIPDAATSQLAIGSTQAIHIGERQYAAQVVAVKPEVNPTTRTRTVVLAIQDTSAGTIAPDQIARLDVTQTVPTDGFWVPITALTQSDRGLWSCFVVVNHSLERRDVEVLHTESDRVLVRGLLQAGDRVVIDGTQRLVPGQSIQG
ncbi:MAG: efflux RND transporter periplasmic adaptor subunit [Oculatellaceae cyanobacterium bins.114]|nr:efflux RND transporter periplasmic adaptor subunit [Oculatellaceae cyanobacterium bins.114]